MYVSNSEYTCTLLAVLVYIMRDVVGALNISIFNHNSMLHGLIKTKMGNGPAIASIWLKESQ